MVQIFSPKLTFLSRLSSPGTFKGAIAIFVFVFILVRITLKDMKKNESYVKQWLRKPIQKMDFWSGMLVSDWLGLLLVIRGRSFVKICGNLTVFMPCRNYRNYEKFRQVKTKTRPCNYNL